MRFLFPLFAFFSVMASNDHATTAILEDSIHNSPLSRIERAIEDGDGLYLVTELYKDVGVGVGHQISLGKDLGLRLEFSHRLAGIFAEDTDNAPVHENLRRYGVFLDWKLADTDHFVYLGSAFGHGQFTKGFSVESGVVWRIQDRFALRLGHEYRDLDDFGLSFGDNRVPVSGRPNHSFRLSLVHFFKKR